MVRCRGDCGRGDCRDHRQAVVGRPRAGVRRREPHDRAQGEADDTKFSAGPEGAHPVVFRFNKFWGNLSITVHGRPVVRDLRMFSVKLTKTYTFPVGDTDQHVVRIDKDRAVFLAGARPQPVRAYVNDALVAEGSA